MPQSYTGVKKTANILYNLYGIGHNGQLREEKGKIVLITVDLSIMF